MKRNVVINLLNDIEDSNYNETRLKKLQDFKKSLTLDKQLGFYVGEYIVHKYLPQLDVDFPSSNQIVYVSEEERKEFFDLEMNWFNSGKKIEGDKKESDEWIKLKLFREKLKIKYLPNPLICYVPLFIVNNEIEFKNGLITALFDSDICNYKITTPEDIIIGEDEYYSTITLSL